MGIRDDEVFDAFVRVWSVWWSGVPDRLARQESSLVVRLLTLGLRQGGISQSDLRRELGLNQSHLSKLMKKLVRVGWIRVKSSKTDGRIGLMTTSAKAEERLAALKQDLETLFPAKGPEQALTPIRKPSASSSTRKRIERQTREPGFNFEALESDGDGSHS